MTDSNNHASAADVSRSNAINGINGAALNISKAQVSPGDVAVSQAAAHIAIAAAIIYLGDCVRERSVNGN